VLQERKYSLMKWSSVSRSPEETGTEDSEDIWAERLVRRRALAAVNSGVRSEYLEESSSSDISGVGVVDWVVEWSTNDGRWSSDDGDSERVAWGVLKVGETKAPEISMEDAMASTAAVVLRPNFMLDLSCLSFLGCGSMEEREQLAFFFYPEILLMLSSKTVAITKLELK